MTTKKIVSLILCMTLLLSTFGAFPVNAEPVNAEPVIGEADAPIVHHSRDDEIEPIGLMSEEGIDLNSYTASGVSESGAISWTIDKGMLSVLGSGAMENYTPDTIPWNEEKQNIKFIYISDDITTIGEYAFYGIENAKSVYIPDGVTAIGKSAFEKCGEMKEIVLPDGLETIGEAAFRDCSKLKDITIPESVKEIGASVLAGCNKLKEIEVEEGNPYYSSDDEGVLLNKAQTVVYAYPGHNKNKRYQVPEGVTEIAPFAFDSAVNLTEITFPGTLLKIGSGAFNGCSEISKITIPASVTEIATDAFLFGCYSMEEINVAEGNAAYSSENGVLFNKDKSAVLRFPEKCTKPCTDGKYILPTTVKTIGEKAFFDCTTVKELHIHGSLEKIEMAAFMNFESLTDIWFGGTKLAWEVIPRGAFNEKLDQVTMHFVEENYATTFNAILGNAYDIDKFVDFNGNEDIKDNAAISSSNPEVATIEGGRMFAVSVGEAIITAVLRRDDVNIAVGTKVIVSEDGTAGKQHTYTMTEGDVWDIKENIEVSNPLYLKALKWASTDERVVAVNKGVVTAVDAGTATVIATYKEYNVRCTITVKPKYTNEEYFQFSNGTITKYIGPDAIVKIPDQIGGVPVTAIGSRAFAYCNHVTKVVLPSTVKSIGMDVFSWSYNLSEIKLNEGLERIDSYAFYCCTSLISITIPATVAGSYGYNWFGGCSGLDTVTFANGTTTIGGGLRYSSARRVILPSTVTTISSDAFYSCRKLQRINIPAGVTSIGTYAFAYCNRLGSIDLSAAKGLTTINSYTFYGCSSLYQVKLPSSLKSIGYMAFCNCSYLAGINIPDSVTSIGDYAFEYCTSLSNVNLGANLTTIGGGAFYGCYDLASIDIPDKVTKIAPYTFYYCDMLQSANLPSSLKEIGDYAFYDCYRLQRIDIPDSVTKIGSYAFYYCSNLSSINFGAGLKTVGSYALGYCQRLTNIDFPDGLTSIGSYVFSGCSGITDIDLGNSLTSIPAYAFSGCYSLKKITIPGSVKNIGSSVFSSCRNITEVVFGEGITSVPTGTFRNCYNLKKVTLPDSVKTIGSDAFYNCYRLEEITLGTGLKTIGSYAFEYCEALRSINIPDSVTSIGYGAFYRCGSLRSVKLGSGLKTISSDAFYYCSSLSDIVIPDGVTSIGSYAFYRNTSLSSIIIPESVTSIGSYAFAYSTSLKEVTIENGSAYIGYNAFYKCPWNPNAVLESSSYTTEENTGMSYIPLAVNYQFKEGAKVTDKKVTITLPSYAFIVSGSMKLNGKTYKNYTEEQGNGLSATKTITIPVEPDTGEIKFCIKSSEYTTISTTARISYNHNGTQEDTIGSLNCKLPVITISAPEITGNATVKVSGLTIPDKTVSLYVDGVKNTTVTANATGAFTKDVTIPNPENHRIYTIKAEVSNNGTIESAQTDIQYVANSPSLTGLKLYYYGGQGYSSYAVRNEVYDLFNTNYKYIQWGYAGSYAYTAQYYQYHFTVNLSNSSQVDKVYVVSTRDGHKEYLEAKWDSSLGAYKTSGYFANDWSYIPNNITVEYTKKIDDVKITLSEMLKYMSFGNGSFSPAVTDYTTTSYSASVSVSPLLASLFGDRIDISTEITDKDYSTVEDSELYPDIDDYHSFPVSQDGKNCVVSFDLTDSTKAVIYIHDKTANKQFAYTMTFADADENGNEAYLDIKELFGRVDAYAGIFMNLFNLNIDTNAIIEGLSKAELEESQLLDLIKKAQNLEIKKNMFLLTSMVLSVANMNNISAPTEVIDYMKALINADITYFGTLKLALTYRIGDEFKIRWKIDPSGYVYEGVTGNRIEGVTATLFCVANENIPKNEDGSYNFGAIDPTHITQWNAEDYDQINPLITDSNGSYRWDVPDDHHWQVKYEKEGYKDTYSEWLPVPPVQEDVNIDLVSEIEPQVEKISLTQGAMHITFNKYMKPDTVKNIKVEGQKLEVTYDENLKDYHGNNVAKEFTVKFDSDLVAGDVYKVTLAGAESHGGQIMADYSADIEAASDKEEFYVSKVTVSGNSIVVRYYNGSAEKKHFTPICAVYDTSDRMIAVKRLDATELESGNKADKQFDFETSWNKYKIFAWDAVNAMKPDMLPCYSK